MDIKSLISLGMLVIIIQQLMMLWMVKTREGGVEVVKIGGAVCLDQNQGVFTTRLEFVFGFGFGFVYYKTIY